MGTSRMMPEKIWNDRGRYGFLEWAELPFGYRNAVPACRKCGSKNVSAAIIEAQLGGPAIEGTDQADPNMLCLDCGFWWD